MTVISHTPVNHPADCARIVQLDGSVHSTWWDQDSVGTVYALEFTRNNERQQVSICVNAMANQSHINWSEVAYEILERARDRVMNGKGADDHGGFP